MTSLSTLTKQAARVCGVDIRRRHNVPELTFLGLAPPWPEMVIDVGANDGGFLQYASKLFAGAQFHCFEPLDEPRERLEDWIRDGGAQTRVAVWPFALGEQDSIATIHQHLDHSASSSLLATTGFNRSKYPQTARQAERQIQVRKLDSWIAEHSLKIPTNSLLKLDVQGYEAQVLRGARAALKRFRICIAEVCVAPLYTEQARFSDLVAILAEAGLDYVGNLDQVHDKSGKPLFLDAVFVRDLYAGRADAR